VPLHLAEKPAKSTAAAVADVLRRSIMRGELKPGERVLQESVAQALSVSRQPVRAAMSLLKAEGLLVEGIGRSMFVRAYSPDDIAENFLLRSVLEGQAAEIAACRISADELARLEGLHEEHLLASKHQLYWRSLEINREFHSVVRQAARMPTLNKIIDELFVGYTTAIPILTPGRLLEAHREHQAVLDGLRSHDASAAGLAMADHIICGRRSYYAQFNSRVPAVED
jgi:DNA-binding GntR family transcriptional regulator